MMHRKVGRKLGMKSQHRKAMMANLCSSLILNQRIETTLTRAKELRGFADRMVTLGKRGTLHARRHALSLLRNKKAVQTVFGDLAKRFADRKGGYTRILKLGFRRGDAAPMAVIEYLSYERKSEKEDTEVEKKAKPKKAAPKKVKKEEKEEKKPAAKKAAAKKTTKKAVPKKKAEKKTKKTTKASTDK